MPRYFDMVITYIFTSLLKLPHILLSLEFVLYGLYGLFRFMFIAGNLWYMNRNKGHVFYEP